MGRPDGRLGGKDIYAAAGLGVIWKGLAHKQDLGAYRLLDRYTSASYGSCDAMIPRYTTWALFHDYDPMIPGAPRCGRSVALRLDPGPHQGQHHFTAGNVTDCPTCRQRTGTLMLKHNPTITTNSQKHVPRKMLNIAMLQNSTW